METFDLGPRHGEEEEAMDIAIGDEYVLYTGGCEGVDQTAEEMGLQLGFKVHVLVGPHHPRARTITPLPLTCWSKPILFCAEPIKPFVAI